MSETTHTPGPWFALNMEHIVAGCDPAPIARVFSGNNANLIAAAPDMLEMLEWVNRLGGFGHDAHERIRAVIAKATAS